VYSCSKGLHWRWPLSLCCTYIGIFYSGNITATPHTHKNTNSLFPVSYPCIFSSPVWLPAHLLTLSLSLHYLCYHLHPPVLTAEVQKWLHQSSTVSRILNMVQNLDWYIHYRLESISFEFPSTSMVSEQGIILCNMYHFRPTSSWIWLCYYRSSKTLMCSIDYKNKHIQSKELALILASL
jgi:hypothetical protein